MFTQPSQGRGDNLRRQHARVPDPKQASSSGAGPFNRFCQIIDLRKKRRQPAGQFSSFDRKVQATRSPVEQVNPECRFQLFDSVGSMRAARYEAFWQLAENFLFRRFLRTTLIVAGRRSDSKNVSFDPIIIFELFMLRL